MPKLNSRKTQKVADVCLTTEDVLAVDEAIDLLNALHGKDTKVHLQPVEDAVDHHGEVDCSFYDIVGPTEYLFHLTQLLQFEHSDLVADKKIVPYEEKALESA